MDIHQLKTLIHVAELGSVSKAADRLNIAQPALSRQIRLLEQELGVRLFERHGRGMVTTEVGGEVLERAGRILAEMEQIRLSASAGGTSLKGTVMVGMTPTITEVMTVPLVERIRSAHPDLGIRFASAFSGHILDWLQRGELELVVSYDPQPLKSLRIVPIMMEELLHVTATAPASGSPGAKPFAHLETEDLVLPSPRHGLRKIAEECARKAGITLNARIEADSFGAMIALVRSGYGSTVLPLAPIYRMVQSGELHATPLVDPTPSRKLVVVYPADRPLSSAARFVGATCVDIATDLVRRQVWVGHLLG